MKHPSRSRVPLIVACSYASIVLLLIILAVMASLIGQDEFGYGAIPALYATYPLGLFVYDKTLNWFIAVGVGGVLNFVLLYSLLWIAGYAFRKGTSNSYTSKSG